MRAAAFLAFACGLAAPGAAMAQALELFDFPNFQGASLRVERDVADLGPGGFDNMATSIRVPGGVWEICEGAGYQECRVISGDIWDLQPMGMNNRISSVRRIDATAPGGAGISGGGVGGGADTPWGPPPGPGPAPGPAPSLTLYETINYGGRSVTLNSGAELRFETFDNRARSLRAVGEWTLCEGANLTGRCERITGDIPDLNRIAMSRTISSVAPAQQAGPPWPPPGGGTAPGTGPIAGPPLPDGPVGPGGERMLAGDRAAFFPLPSIPAARLGGCLRGDARACENEVDQYCRGRPGGWVGGAYYAVDTRRQILTDVLCVR